MSDIKFSKGNIKRPSPRTIKYIVILIVLIILISNSLYTVDAKQRGIVLRWGKEHRQINETGLMFKLPFIDKVYLVQTVNESLTFGSRTTQAGVQTKYSNQDLSYETQALTADLNIINLPFDIQYRITEPFDWLFGVDDSKINTQFGIVENREKTIRDVSTSVVNRYIGDISAEEVQEKGIDLIAQPAQEEINRVLTSLNLGVTIQSLNLKEVRYNDSVREAIEDVNSAEQDRDRLFNEGREIYNKEIDKVQGEADRLVASAVGSISRFNYLYEQYVQNPEIFRQRYYYETMEGILANSENVEIIDKSLDNFLPIKQLSQVQGVLK